MATIKGLFAKMLGSSCFGNGFVSDGKATPPAALALGDVIVLGELPAGHRLTGLKYRNGDFDTGTTLTVSLGYRSTHPDQQVAAAPSYFLADSTAFRAAQASWVDLAFEPITFQEPVQLIATVTAAATGVSGTPSINTVASGHIVGVA